MKNKNLLFAGILLMLVVFCSLYFFSKQNELIAKTPRTYKRLTSVDNIGVDFDAYRIQLYNSDVYVLDLSGNRVVKLNSKGHLQKAYEIERQDPTDTRLIISFDVDSQGVHMAEVKKKEFLSFRHDGSIMRAFKPVANFSRVRYMGNGTYAVKAFNTHIQDDEVVVVDTENNIEKKLHQILKYYGDGGMATDGFLLRNSNGIIAHVSYLMADIILFDQDGNVIGRGNTLDAHLTPPKVMKTPDGHYTMPANTIQVNGSGYMDNKYLYIQSNIRSTSENKDEFNANSVIDVYSLENLSYRFSYYVPNASSERITDFAIENSMLYALQGKSILKYKL